MSSGNPNQDYNTDIKNSLDVEISNEYPEEVPALVNITKRVCIRYTEDIGMYVPIYSVEKYAGRIYKKGEGFYKKHADATNQITGCRSLSILFYLNDITEGGELEFPQQGVKIQPKEGLCVIFPSAWTHPHGAHIPLAEDRYIIRTFTRMEMEQ